MRIGFDAKRLFNNYTGLGNYSRSLVKNLLLLFPDDEYVLYTPRLSKMSENECFLNSEGVRIFQPNGGLKSYWRTFSIRRQLEKDKIDVYHGLSNEVPMNIKKSVVRSVVTIHDLIFKTLPDTFPFIDRKIYDIKFRKSCYNADRIIAISESTKNDIVRFYNVNPHKIDVVYQSCNPLFFQPADESLFTEIQKKHQIPSEFLLFVGSVEKRKNIQLIIDAYQHLGEKYQLPLVVVGGRRSYTEEFIKLLKERKLENKVKWVSGLKNNRALQIVYHKAQALIYPSFYEGFGLPVVEALLSKTPVITSNVSSLPEAAGPDSLKVDPNNAEELAAAIVKVLESSDLRQKMKENGYAYATKNFSAEKTASNTMAVYRKIM